VWRAGGLKEWAPRHQQTVVLSIWLTDLQVALEAAPHLIISRRLDPVLNRGWQEMMQLQVVHVRSFASYILQHMSLCVRVCLDVACGRLWNGASHPEVVKFFLRRTSAFDLIVQKLQHSISGLCYLCMLCHLVVCHARLRAVCCIDFELHQAMQPI